MALLEITETKEVNAVTLTVEAGVRYWEDATVNEIEDGDGSLMPFRRGDFWCPIIDIDAGKVRDWPAGTVASVHYKVCDDGAYVLRGDDGSALFRREGYVPGILAPGGNGYGDYIIMEIDETGKIANWNPDLSAFVDDDE